MSTAFYHMYNPSDGEGSGPIFLSNVSCNGSESQLLDCPYETPERHCNHSLDAGLYCTTCEYHNIIYLTLGTHAQRGLRYLVCVCVP